MDSVKTFHGFLTRGWHHATGLFYLLMET